jgi:hypothetical protein
MSGGFRVVRDAAWLCRGCGPNDGTYDPAVPPGGAVSVSDVWVPIDPLPAEAAEAARLGEIDGHIRTDTFGTPAYTMRQLADLTWTDFSTWWTNNVTTLASANAVLKRVTFLVLRALRVFL